MHTQIRCGCMFPQCCWGYHPSSSIIYFYSILSLFFVVVVQLTLTRFRIDLYIISSQLNRSWVSCFKTSIDCRDPKNCPLSGWELLCVASVGIFGWKQSRPFLAASFLAFLHQEMVLLFLQAELEAHAEQLPWLFAKAGRMDSKVFPGDEIWVE